MTIVHKLLFAVDVVFLQMFYATYWLIEQHIFSDKTPALCDNWGQSYVYFLVSQVETEFLIIDICNCV